MKQLKWIIILAVSALVLLVVFIIVDNHAQKEKEQEAIGGPQRLISFDSAKTTRITIDNEEGHLAFEWSAETGAWKVVSEEKFNVNSYAIAAICNYLCNLCSEKTVSFNCKDTSVYGFDKQITIKAYTDETGENNPYTLFVGNHTPTNNAFYAMIEGSNDVFTISYEAGSIFCVAKNTLKNMYLFDTSSSLVNYYKHTQNGKTIIEMTRGDDFLWKLNAPGSYELQKAAVDNLLEIVVRSTVDGYVEEHPTDLKKYGLDNPTDILILKGANNTEKMSEEIWFGSAVSEKADETCIYGYFKNSEQVFRIKKANVSFLSKPLSSYVYPYCIDVSGSDLKEIDIDLGEAAAVRAKMTLDVDNNQFALDDTDIDALNDDKISTLYQNLFRSVAGLQFSDTVPDAQPDLSAAPAMTIKFIFKDGHERLLSFIEFEKNNFYVIDTGKYTGLTIRMSRFEGTGSIPFNYEELKRALKG